MRKRKRERVCNELARVFKNNNVSLSDSAVVMTYLLVSTLMVDGGHNKEEWLTWIETIWDNGEKIVEDLPPNVVSFKKKR